MGESPAEECLGQSRKGASEKGRGTIEVIRRVSKIQVRRIFCTKSCSKTTLKRPYICEHGNNRQGRGREEGET